MASTSTDRRTSAEASTAVSTQVANFAEILRRQTEDSMLSASRMVETLREARSLKDVIEVQSAFILRSAEDYATLARQLGDLLAAFPLATPTASPVAKRFEMLVGEAISGVTKPITGLSRDERRKALFDVDR